MLAWPYSRQVSPAVSARPRRTRRKQKASVIAAWWPLLVLLALTPFAVRGASLLALVGPGALRAAFPFAGRWGGMALWAELPVYGLLLSLFARKRRFGAGLLTVVLLHAAAVVFASLL